MKIHLTDLAPACPFPTLRLEAAQWSLAIGFLKHRKLLSSETLARLEESPGGIQITEDIARKLGRYFIRRACRAFEPPKPSIDWGPIATLNGVWIDPILAVQEAHWAASRKAFEDVAALADFFLTCRGFKVN